MTAAQKLYETLIDQWKSGKNAELKLHCENGSLKVTLHADLGPWAQPDCLWSPVSGNGSLHKASPSPGRLRRRERRAAERAAAEQAAAKCAATLKAVAEEADEEAAVEIGSSDVAGKAAAEKVDAMKVDFAEENDAKKAAAEECTAEKAAAEKADVVVETVAAEKTTAEKVGEEESATAENAASTSCCGSEKPANVQTSCWNCDGVMTPEHQCNSTPVGDAESEETALLPLCHYCCHLGSGLNPVHYYLQCLCSDKIFTCQCYCSEKQLKHKRQYFPTGFTDVKCVDVKDRPRARATAEARAYKLDFRGVPMALRPCEAETCVRM